MVHLIIVRYVMLYTLSLTYELQAKKLDVVKACKAVENVLESWRNCQKAVDSWHEEWYKEAVKFSAKFDVSPSIKRIPG